MFNRIFFILLFIPVLTFSQNCSLTLSGHIEDANTGSPLEYVDVVVESTSIGTVTDSKGIFTISNLCKGEYHIILSYIGYESKKVFVTLDHNVTKKITLEPSENKLNEVIITAKNTIKTTQNVASLNQRSIVDNATENLGNMLTAVVGVSALKTGNGIAKPVIHGLYGNRLTILNNGVTQSGQQWGNDHSPEIDPLVANKIRVIKGTSALEYMGSNLGNVVLVEPKRIYRDPHLHGSAHYSLETNGLSNGLHLQLQKYNPKISWKINGTLKKSGDKRTANYYLTNTGAQEANLAIQLEKKFSEKIFSDFYLSTYNTELGILRGAHIGNLTDLEEAFQRETPFFTSDQFSYSIASPKQKVNHHLLKIHSKYLIDETQQFNITFAGQYDNRNEYDVRRGGRSETPALSLQQFSYFIEAKYKKEFLDDFLLKSGIQLNAIDNANNPQTGILPLIPDYLSYETGIYLVGSKKTEKSYFQLGARYDNVNQNVAAISTTLPREIIRYENTFHKWGTSFGWKYTINDAILLSYNIGLATRNPAINELYSFGLHQGVSGIEEGNINLQTEKSFKTTLGFNTNSDTKFVLDILAYYQKVNDYIFLEPQDEIRLTIRGAFPVFKYKQTNAEIFGADISSKYQINPSFNFKINYSYIRGVDLKNNLFLINLPSNTIHSSIAYKAIKPLKIGKKSLENFTLKLSDQYVFKQNNILPEQDFVAAPDAYNLLNMKIATDLQLSKTRLRFTFKIENILNVSYRDYLNRQRYFADDLGINAVLGIGITF